MFDLSSTTLPYILKTFTRMQDDKYTELWRYVHVNTLYISLYVSTNWFFQTLFLLLPKILLHKRSRPAYPSHTWRHLLHHQGCLIDWNSQSHRHPRQWSSGPRSTISHTPITHHPSLIRTSDLYPANGLMNASIKLPLATNLQQSCLNLFRGHCQTDHLGRKKLPSPIFALVTRISAPIFIFLTARSAAMKNPSLPTIISSHALPSLTSAIHTVFPMTEP